MQKQEHEKKLMQHRKILFSVLLFKCWLYYESPKSHLELGNILTGACICTHVNICITLQLVLDWQREEFHWYGKVNVTLKSVSAFSPEIYHYLTVYMYEHVVNYKLTAAMVVLTFFTKLISHINHNDPAKIKIYILVA